METGDVSAARLRSVIQHWVYGINSIIKMLAANYL